MRAGRVAPVASQTHPGGTKLPCDCTPPNSSTTEFWRASDRDCGLQFFTRNKPKPIEIRRLQTLQHGLQRPTNMVILTTINGSMKRFHFGGMGRLCSFVNKFL